MPILLTFLMMMGLVLNDSVGPYILWMAVAGWGVYVACYPQRMWNAVTRSGAAIWLVPGLALLSVLWSARPDVTFRSAAETLVMVSIMVMIAKTVRPQTFIILLFLTLICVALPSVAFNNLTYDFLLRRSNLTGIFVNKNTFSLCSALLIISSFSVLLNRQINPWVRASTIPLIGLGMVQNWQSNSVAATLALVLALLWGGSMITASQIPRRWRDSYVTFLVTGGAVLVGVGTLLAYTFMDDLLEMVNKDPTLTGRTELWFYASRMISDNPILGVGYDSFWIRDNPMAIYFFESTVPSTAPMHLGFSFHNLYYEVAVELGFVGVLCAAIFVAASFYYSVRWLRSEPSSESIFFFTLVVFVLIVQTQGYDLFATFNVFYGLFLVTFIYGHNRVWHTVVNQMQQALRHETSDGVAAII